MTRWEINWRVVAIFSVVLRPLPFPAIPMRKKPIDALGRIVDPSHSFVTATEPDEAERERPEVTCQRCGRPDAYAWPAPSPLWNAVMGDQPWGIVCPPCFAELAEANGFRYTWHFGPHEDVSTLWTDADGREWDADKCLWVDPQVIEAEREATIER